MVGAVGYHLEQPQSLKTRGSTREPGVVGGNGALGVRFSMRAVYGIGRGLSRERGVR
jgi:hypothetical protein